MNEYLFSYGTLQKESVQLDLFGRLVPGATDVLRGFKVSVIEIKEDAFLATGEQSQQLIATPTNDANDSIKGTVLELTEKELQVADQYEPDAYKRTKVVLESGKEAWIYTAAETNS